MKTKVLILVGILIIAFAAVVAPAMAAGTGIATITGNPAKTISLTVNGGTIGLNLDPTAPQPITDSTTATLDVSSNSPGWTVSVKDALDGSKPSAGKMVNYTTASSTYGTLALGSALNVGSASYVSAPNGFVGTSHDLTGSDQAIETGASDTTAANSFTATALTFKQTVVITDPVLPSGQVYRIIVTFTGSTP
jgi:hypothetical protein